MIIDAHLAALAVRYPSVPLVVSQLGGLRPTLRNLLAALRELGFAPVTAQRLDQTTERRGTAGRDTTLGIGSDRCRRYVVILEDGASLDVTLVDREQQARAFFHRARHSLLMRPICERRGLKSLRHALERETLLTHAAIAAGARTPKLLAASELGPDAVMLVHEHVRGRSLDTLDDDDVSEQVVDSAWEQVRALHTRRIAHRRLTGDALLVDESGRIHLTGLQDGEVAAGDLLLRMDVAQLLTTFALRVGPERSVSCATRVLGPDAVAGSLPLLQPLVFSRSTRDTLRRHAKERAEREREAVPAAVEPVGLALSEGADGLKATRAGRDIDERAREESLARVQEDDILAQIRRQVLRVRPQAPVAPVRLERIKPRTLIALITSAFAVHYLFSQLVSFDFGAVFQEADWTWVVVALTFSALTYVAAAMSLLGFVPEKVLFGKTVLAQFAASLVVMPAAVGGVALNTRFLQRNRVRSGHAVASVGASQLAAGVIHALLVLVFGYMAGTRHTEILSPSSSRVVIGGLLTAAVLVLVMVTVPYLRRFVMTRMRTLLAGVVPRMLDLLQHPRKLLTGVGGILMFNLCFCACLDASVRAFGHSLSYSTIALVYLVGSAAGSAVPTPGGIGAIETSLVTALTLAGLPENVAFPAVLLHRLLTFWLPILPGWAPFVWLTRKQLL
ncbi:lysylphosphatidylglycerol synthase transmembrane domain-containing protein [Streptomyces seoulensis]|uniref:flippase-like domain-containing protein n=1 Tax=Streptomyces seoulensis TaxID=73044 RepID=UPI00069186E3